MSVIMVDVHFESIQNSNEATLLIVTVAEFSVYNGIKRTVGTISMGVKGAYVFFQSQKLTLL